MLLKTAKLTTLVVRSFSLNMTPKVTRVPETRVHPKAHRYLRMFQLRTEDQHEGTQLDHRITTLNTQETHENNYVYRHVYKRLNHFTEIGQRLTSLPINSYIVKLRELVKTKQDLQESAYKESVASILVNTKSLIKLMNQQELAVLLTGIKHDNQQEFRMVKRMIDIELRWLLKNHVNTRLMDLDLWFYLADTFYASLMKSNFVHVLVNYLATREGEVNITNRQFIHLLFLVILQRDQRGILSRYEQRMFEILEKGSFEDIATICMAYFKTKTPISNTEILRRIIDRTTEFLPTMDPNEPGYCSIIKSVRYSAEKNQGCRENVLHLVMTLMEDLESRIVLTSPYNAVHTLKLTEAFRVYDPDLLSLVWNAMSQGSDFRIKDIQYALSSLSNFAFMDLKLDGNLIQKFNQLSDDIVAETRHDVGKQEYHLMPILRAFAIFGYYNDKLLKYANSLLDDPMKVKHMTGVLEFERSALLVYVASRIEGGQVKLGKEDDLKKLSSAIDRWGNIGSVRQDSSIKHLDFILRGSSGDFYANSNLYRTMAKSLASTQELKDPAYKFVFQYTFPHQNYADLVITKESCEPGSFDEKSLMPKRVPAGQRHCLLVSIRNDDYVDGYRRLSGFKQLLIRLLTKLGYTVIRVNLDEPDIEGVARRIKLALDG